MRNGAEPKPLRTKSLHLDGSTAAFVLGHGPHFHARSQRADGGRMRRRFVIDDDGNLRDRDGVVLGKVVGLTLDVPNEASVGGLRGEEEKKAQGEGRKEGGLGETIEGGGPTAREEEGDANRLFSLASAPEPRRASEEVDEIWGIYVSVMNPRRREASPEERKLIREALKHGTVEEWKRAIINCSQSPFHMGKNDRGKKYNQLSQIVRGKRGRQTIRERLDFFLELPSEQLSAVIPSDAPAEVQTAKAAVQRAAAHPNHREAQSQHMAAVETLSKHGIKVSYEPIVINGVDTGSQRVRFSL